MTFNNYDWYIIADDSTAVNEGTVTLLAREPIESRRFDESTDEYSISEIKQYLDSLTEENGSFAGVANAIAPTDLKDVSVTGAKLYLLSEKELFELPTALIGCSDIYWLRSKTYYLKHVKAVIIYKYSNGLVPLLTKDYEPSTILGVRPALRLDLSKVSFSSESKEFKLNSTQHTPPSADMTVSTIIEGLPDHVTLKNEADVNAAVEAYLSLTKAQKALVASDLRQKLAKAEDVIITAKAKARTTRIISVKNQKSRSVVVRWKKTSDAYGYQIRYSISKTFKKGVKTKKVKKSETKITLKKIKKGKIYYVQVKPYTKVTNRITGKSKVILGKALNTKKVKTKK